MEIQISKQKALKVKLEEANTVISGQKRTIKEEQEHVNKLNANL